jgi:hypothetical protein
MNIVRRIWGFLLFWPNAALLILAWLFGAPYKVTKTINGQKTVVGTLRWFKFTKV